MSSTFIYDAVRTPRGKGRAPKDGKPGGALCSVAPHDLVSGLSSELHQRHAGIDNNISHLSLGCVGQVASQGGNVALVSRMASGLPNSTTATSVNNLCVSSLTAVNQSAAWSRSKPGDLVLAGGVESLSQVGFMADKAAYMADPDLMKRFKYAPPVMGAELVATLEGFTKTDLDEVTLMSHHRAASAWDAGYYDSGVVPVKQGDTILLERDEAIRGNMTMEKLASMEPGFAKLGSYGADAMMLAEHPELSEINHVHSFANCPPMTDAAALVLMGDKKAGEKAGIAPKAKVRGYVEASSDPVIQFLGGFKAMDQVLAETGLTLADIDRIEFMEAFAATPLKFYRDYKPDMDKVNVNGGHLAMGHPMGATGAVLLTTLVHELDRCDGKIGMVVASAASGIGSAMIIERV
ncbi:MAG: acetyl-CoA C-acyltransferase [Alphaproteobacteria bacterium]